MTVLEYLDRERLTALKLLESLRIMQRKRPTWPSASEEDEAAYRRAEKIISDLIDEMAAVA